MVSRHWHALAEPSRADEYVHHLQTETFPAIRAIPGFVAAWIHRRDAAGGVEFIVETHWTSLDAIRAFAGSDAEHAVVPEKVRKMMRRFDERARHYEIAG